MNAFEDIFTTVSVELLVGDLQLLQTLFRFRHHLLVRAAFVVNLDERRHVDLVKFVRVRVRNLALATPKSDLPVAALDSLALVQAHIDGAAELNVR